MSDAGPYPWVDRREVVMGGVAAAVAGASPALAQQGAGTVKLRLLATTDIHVNVASYDYYRDAPDETVGLAKVAALVDAARAGARNTLVFDNGDFNQGNPLGDFIALEKGLKADDVHPVIAAMNLIGYDAATLGNHEFNYGLDFLDRCLAGARFPFVSANAVSGTLAASPRADRTFLKPYLILDRDVIDEAGVSHRLRVGVIGVLPPQIVQWDEAHLRGRIVTRDIVETVAAWLPEIREAGADIIVALAHTGISGAARRGGDENAALYLARIPGIDAIITGHQHQVFPGPNYAKIDGVDVTAGTLNGVPAVMPGFWGSHLGQIDLTLQKDGGRFRVVGHGAGVLPIFRREAGKVIPLVEAKPALLAAVKAGHEGTLAYVRKTVGRTTERLETYFATISDCAALQIISEAQLWAGRKALAGGPHAALPLLSAVAPFKAGGRGGPAAYTDVPAGDIAIRNVADIYVFPNTLKVVKVSGAELKDWLERAAGIFFEIKPGDAEQVLVNPAFPAYNFDVIDGVNYRIDVAQPSKFDGDGKLINPAASRIVDLSYQGRPVQAGDAFAVITNNYRASGGGTFAGAVTANIIYDSPDYSRDIVSAFLAQAGTVAPKADGNWALAPQPQATNIVFETSPAARDLAAARPHLTPLADGPSGFARYRIALR